VPAKFVGGDFFDWYPIQGGIAFTLADVMGKGVGAGIVAATVRATIRTARDEGDVELAVDRAARALAEDLREADSFVTLFHARLNAADGRLSFVDAGHGLSVIVDPDGAAHRLESGDFPLGTVRSVGWHQQEVVLERGATLVSFSDGVLDLYDGTLASVDRVGAIVAASSTAQDVVDEIARLARSQEATDDVTVVAIRRRAS
jgi:serine phosphatase RsbU (regulator of sigma subunit)